jgi:hypothetical protein
MAIRNTRREKLVAGPATNACGRVAFRTRKLARKGAERMPLPPDSQHRPYKCDGCELWHVGHIPALVAQGVVTTDEWYGRNNGPAYRDILIPLLDLARRHLGGQPWFERREHPELGDLWTAAGDAYGQTLYARDYDDPVSAVEALIAQHTELTDQLAFPEHRLEDAA